MWGVEPSQPGIRQALIWRSLDGLSMEHCELIQPMPELIHLNGLVIGVEAGSPLNIVLLARNERSLDHTARSRRSRKRNARVDGA
jgi:hypothetical protein